MKKFIYSLFIIAIPALSFASDNEFAYDKDALTTEFSQLDKVSTYVEETNVSYSELTNSRVFEGNIELTNSIALQPNWSFSDMDWGAFAWGFCCWPVGIFTVLLNDDKDQDSKISYYVGIVAGNVGAVIAWVILNVAFFASAE